MFNWLKKHFIPHDGNDHQPHFLRQKNIRLMVISVLLIEIALISLPFVSSLNPFGNNFLAAVLPSVLDDLTNQNRQAQNLPVLSVSPLLNKVAELKAQDMAKLSYFAHTSPEGKGPWYWFNLAGYKYEYAGENLAIDFNDSKDVDTAWMNSPTHKANIMKVSYTEIGTAIATGTYQGINTIFVAQVFGKPASPAQSILEVVSNSLVTSTHVKQPSAVVAVGSSTNAKVMGAETDSAPATSPIIATGVILATSPILATSQLPANTYTKTSIFEQYVTSPRHIVDMVLIILAAVITIALLLKLFIRMDKKHPILITNGLVVLVLIVGFYAVNNLVSEEKFISHFKFYRIPRRSV